MSEEPRRESRPIDDIGAWLDQRRGLDENAAG